MSRYGRYGSMTNRTIANLLFANFVPTANALTKQFFAHCHDEALSPAEIPTPLPLNSPIFIMTRGSCSARANLEAAITKVKVEVDRCDAALASLPTDSKAYEAAQSLRDTLAGALNAMREAQDNASC